VVDKAFWAAGVERRVAVRVAHTMGITSMVSNTDLLVVVPHRLARACVELVDVTVLELPIDIPKFNIAQYWHERFHTDPGNRWLRGVVCPAIWPPERARTLRRSGNRVNRGMNSVAIRAAALRAT